MPFISFLLDWWVSVTAAVGLLRAPVAPRPWVQAGASAGPSGHRLVVFLHGVHPVNRAIDVILADIVGAVGDRADIVAPQYAYETTGLLAPATEIAASISMWRRTHPGGKVLVVGHSMGGRLAVEVERIADNEVDAVITCGSPLQGTWAESLQFAKGFIGACGPLNPLLARNPRKFTCVGTWTDHAVFPLSMTTLVGSHANLTVGGMHWGIPRTATVMAEIRKFIL